jgi:hypothetical protein
LSKVFFCCSFIHMYIYCLGHFSPLPFSPTLSPSPTQFQAGPLLPLSLILLKKRHKHNKEDKVFLLVELRIAIQRDSYYCFCVPLCYDPCWFNSNWSLHWFLIHCSWQPVVPLEWGHQMLSCFEFSTHSYISHMCSPLVLWSKSKHIAAFFSTIFYSYTWSAVKYCHFHLIFLTC